VHLAALSTPWGRRHDFLATNVEGTRRVLAAARAAGVRRLVHVSSPSVTFDNRDRRGVTEAEPRPARFLSAYQESKALAEDLVRAATGLETVIVRPRAIFGPGDTSLLPRLLARARTGRLRIVGSGHNLADLTYVDNVVDALLLARDVPGAAGRTYLIANGEPVVLWDFIATCLRGLGLAPPTRHVPFQLAFALAGAAEALHRALPALGEPPLTRYTVALLGRDQTIDLTAARRDLGYAARVSLAEGLDRAIDDFRARATA
jgi:nucleoside-diphosphate-sugar epimerase